MININNKWIFTFHFDFNLLEIVNKITPRERRRCFYCPRLLELGYIFIIQSLKNSGLLDKEFKMVCCFCNIMDKLGLLHLSEQYNSWQYKEGMDILTLRFSIRGVFNGYLQSEHVDFRIHEWEKISHLIL